MGALTPSFLYDFESNISTIAENEYANLSANLWWSRFMKVRPSSSRREVIAWLLSTAQIESRGKGGQIAFEDLISKYTEYENLDAGAGFKIRKQELEDKDGKGLETASQWASDIGAYMAYWPQKQLVNLLKNGETSGNNSYDGVTYFNKAHLYRDDATSTFANVFSGAAASTPATDLNDAGYPGAIVLDDSVTVDVALQNLSKAIAYIKSIKMPNLVDPRFLRPVALFGGPRMQNRLVQLTSAKFLAQAASSGGGSGDVEAVIRAMGFTTPVIADEFAGFESDTTTFLICEQLSSSQLGPFVYVEREPFSISQYGLLDDAQLGRMQELEWHCTGRNVAGYGHPFLAFKLKAT
ncbi:MAG: hypothetical protein HOW73_05650 [Polyangiaceae bacterium]|nr:hypothetical protein [Polyangiaceae bacterium]